MLRNFFLMYKDYFTSIFGAATFSRYPTKFDLLYFLSLICEVCRRTTWAILTLIICGYEILVSYLVSLQEEQFLQLGAVLLMDVDGFYILL